LPGFQTVATPNFQTVHLVVGSYIFRYIWQFIFVQAPIHAGRRKQIQMSSVRNSNFNLMHNSISSCILQNNGTNSELCTIQRQQQNIFMKLTCRGSGSPVYLQHLLFLSYSFMFQNLENEKKIKEA
jgi:hypothetical protein